MAPLKLFIGNKAYTSWSLRSWLTLVHAGLDFEEVVLPFEGSAGIPVPAIRERSPSGKVPLLEHGELQIWDSLAIAEYIAELRPEAQLWPSERAARAVARSISAEIHSGFAALRSAMPMNVRREPFRLAIGAEAQAEITRVLAIWTACRGRHGAGGDFLFGRFGIADAMFAPVATRFWTYGVPLDRTGQAYVDAIYALPSLQRWLEAAHQETWFIDRYERVGR